MTDRQLMLARDCPGNRGTPSKLVPRWMAATRRKATSAPEIYRAGQDCKLPVRVGWSMSAPDPNPPVALRLATTGAASKRPHKVGAT